MLTLYFSPGASSFATHMALYEVGAPFEAKPVLLGRKDNRREEYLRINPEGKVPCLVADGHAITEVAATLYYLANRYPEKKFWPPGLDDQTKVISWMSFTASALHPARLLGADEAAAVWKIAEDRFGKGPFVLGDAFSIADIHLFRLFWRYFGSRKPDPAAFPRLMGHYHRMMERPAVRKTLEVETAVQP